MSFGSLKPTIPDHVRCKKLSHYKFITFYQLYSAKETINPEILALILNEIFELNPTYDNFINDKSNRYFINKHLEAFRFAYQNKL